MAVSHGTNFRGNGINTLIWMDSNETRKVEGGRREVERGIMSTGITQALAQAALAEAGGEGDGS